MAMDVPPLAEPASLAMKPLKPEDISKKYREKISTQSYAKRDLIEGVKILELKRFLGEDGSFLEMARFSEGKIEGLEEFEVAQVSYSEVLPGAIKAWHLHFSQEDVWFVPPNARLLVGLWDVREKSPTTDQKMRLIMGDGKAQLVYIPRGVAHGAANLWDKAAEIIYFVNNQFDPQNPDEQRLAWDAAGKNFWELVKG